MKEKRSRRKIKKKNIGTKRKGTGIEGVGEIWKVKGRGEIKRVEEKIKAERDRIRRQGDTRGETEGMR